MSTTTIESIIRRAGFDYRVAALRAEAAEHGAAEQHAICLIAEEGRPGEGVRERFCGLGLTEREIARLDDMTQDDAIRECARVLRDGPEMALS